MVIDLDHLIHLFHEHPCARIAYGSEPVYGILFHIESTLLQVYPAILKEFINWPLFYKRILPMNFPTAFPAVPIPFMTLASTAELLSFSK